MLANFQLRDSAIHIIAQGVRFALAIIQCIDFLEPSFDVFDARLGVVERVTLMFAIDDTGSMGSEIVAVKAIAKYIIEYPSRQYTEIDYVLSPFNDPSMYSVFFFRLILSF